MLGGNLAIYRSESNEISNCAHYIVAAVRMLVYPLVGIGIVFGSYKGGLIQDPFLALIMMLLYTTPPATNLMLMANLHHNL